MPMYDYQCECGRRDDVLCRAGQKPQVKCECGKNMKRIFSVPSIVTDSTFMANRSSDYLDNNPAAARNAMQLAKQQGVCTGHGHFYSTQLQKWIGSRDDVKSECERQGRGCEEMGVKGVKSEPGPYKVAEDIVDEHAENTVIREHGGRVSVKKYEEIKQDLRVSLVGNED